MNGATAVPEVKTTRLPNRTRQRMIGNSQNFFRSFMKDQSSKRNSPMNTSIREPQAGSRKQSLGCSFTNCCLLFTVYCLLTSTALSNAMPDGAFAEYGSCPVRVSTRG